MFMTNSLFASSSQDVQVYIKDILDSSPTKMTEEEYTGMLDELTSQFQLFINQRVMSQLSEETQKSYVELLSSTPTVEQVQLFMTTHMPNHTTVIQLAMQEFKSQFTTN